MKSSDERHSSWLLVIGIAVGVLALTAGPALAALTFSGTGITGDGAVVIDSSSTISIGSSSTTVMFPGELSVGIPDVQPTGVATPSGGSTFYDYYVVARFADGATTAGGTQYANVNDGPAALDGTHYIDISWPAVPGAVSYDIYTDERDGTPSSVGKLGNVSAGTTTFRDNGVVGNGTPLYPFNTAVGTASITGSLTQAEHSADPAFGGAGFTSSLNVDADKTFAQAAYFNTSLERNITQPMWASRSVITDNGFSSHDLVASYNQVDSTGPMTSDGQLYNSTAVYAQNLQAAAATVNNFYGNGSVTAHIDTYNGLYLAQPTWAGNGTTVTNMFGIYIEDMVPTSPVAGQVITNPYYSWFDSQGVRRVKEDSTVDGIGQAIEALYNPRFTKYTPGATNYERVILGEWKNNVAEIGTEAGGTGTLRPLDLIGPNVGIGLTGVAPSTTLQVAGASSTILIGGAALPGCIEVGNSNGSAGINYVTFLNGVMTATTTKPSNCQ